MPLGILPASTSYTPGTYLIKLKSKMTIAISKSIAEDVLAHSSEAFTIEDTIVVRCEKQAVFKVRPATRCSATLSGEHI